VKKQKMEMVVLNNLIDTTSEPREVKRGLAVKLRKMGYAIKVVAELLNVTAGYVVKWNGVYKKEGVRGLRLQYKGSAGYLDDEQKGELIAWLKEKESWNLRELQKHIQQKYNLSYKSKQSYYDLFKAAGISWKKSQSRNPKKDPEQVAAKQSEIKQKFKMWREAVLLGDVVLLFVDECHLLWGDVCGYIWGRTDQRIEIPVTNDKERQTYFGTLNCLDGEMVGQAYSAGNSENTVKFLDYLQQQYPDKRLVIIWDGASYHRFGQTPEYLAKINQDLPEDAWIITCLLFAPNAPEQNPVEDVWLKGKNFIRKHFQLCHSFKEAKKLFVETLQHQTFDFSKLLHYRQFLHFI
jgi:putative transposase